MAPIYSVLAFLLLQLLAVQAKLVKTSNENNRELIQSFANNFPSITRDLHPEELKLKAHSSIHLGEQQPEIFASLEHVLTPYFQEILGENLIAYDLKVKYSEGEETDVEDIVVTNMLVSCILTVRSDSVEQLKYHTHDNANKWFFDFFDGLNVYKFLGQLRDNEIEVGELVFQDEEFRSPLLNGGVMPGDLDSIDLGSPVDGGGQAGSIVGAFVGVMVVGGVLAYRYKEKIPWEKIQEKSIGGGSSATSSLGSSAGSSSKKTAMSRLSNGIEKGVEVGKRVSTKIKKEIAPKLDGAKTKLAPHVDAAKSKQAPHLDAAKVKLAPHLDAAKSKMSFIQERVSIYKNKPGQQQQAFEDDSEAPDSLSSSRKKTRTSLLDSSPYNPFQPITRPPPSEGTYSVGGDFGVGEEYEASTQRSPTISSYSGYGREIVFGADDDVEEFSMPDDYNTVADFNTVADDYSVHCHSILGLMENDQKSVDTRLSRKPWRNDINDDDDTSRASSRLAPRPQPSQGPEPDSPFFTDMDEWSMDGYSLASRPAAPTRGGSGGRSHLNMPHLTQDF